MHVSDSLCIKVETLQKYCVLGCRDQTAHTKIKSMKDGKDENSRKVSS